MKTHRIIALSVAVGLIAGSVAVAQTSDSDLAKKTQNPVADLISLPLQNNFNTGVGIKDEMQYVLNIQPVIPTAISDDWNLINRVIVPVIYQPFIAPGLGEEWGVSDVIYQGFFSPREASDVTWGLGPVIQFPTATDPIFGSEEWAAGPTLVVLKMTGPWVVGSTLYNIWSFEDGSVNKFLWQYFVNYNFDSGAYLTSAPIITADWNADSSQRWTVPFGLGAGKILRVGGAPVNTSLHAYYNVEKPDLMGADWQIRFQVQFLFPK